MLILEEIYIRDLYISMHIHGLVFVASRYLLSIEHFFSRAFQGFKTFMHKTYRCIKVPTIAAVINVSMFLSA